MSNYLIRQSYIADKPGCLPGNTANQMHRAIDQACEEPSCFCDLEGAGPVRELERAILPVVGGEYVLAVSSGTAAIHTALLAAGIGPGDQVITPSFTWPQSAAPIVFCGAEPVWVDVEPDTGHIDPVKVAEAITPRTKAILVPHLFGHVADLPTLQMLARTAGVLLISDAAQAMGATFYGKPAGDYSDMACNSLGRGKLLSTGEGGLVTFRHREHYERTLKLTQHPDRYFRETGKRCSGFALNYRMHPWQAMCGLASLEDMHSKLEHRRNVYQAFAAPLNDAPAIETLRISEGVEHAAYGVFLKAKSPKLRDALLRKSYEKGFDMAPGIIPEPQHMAFARERINPNEPWLTESISLPNSERLCFGQQLWPLGPLEMDEISMVQASKMGRELVQLGDDISTTIHERR